MVPSLEYLYTASRASLQSFELAHLNHASNLRREIAVLMDQWIEETAEAMLARCMLDHYTGLRRPASSDAEVFPPIPEPATDLLPSTTTPPPESLSAQPKFVDLSSQSLTATLVRKSRK
jgi:hypothetical protein